MTHFEETVTRGLSTLETEMKQMKDSSARVEAGFVYLQQNGCMPGTRVAAEVEALKQSDKAQWRRIEGLEKQRAPVSRRKQVTIAGGGVAGGAGILWLLDLFLSALKAKHGG